MDLAELTRSYDFCGRTIVVTGATGILGGEMACALVGCGANVAMLDRNLDPAKGSARVDGARRRVARGGRGRRRARAREPAAGLRRDSRAVRPHRRPDQRGRRQQARRRRPSKDQSFFDLPPDALRWVFDLNLVGTILPSQVFGRVMADQGEGVILNVSSMNAFRPLTRIAGLLGRQGRRQQLHAVAGGPPRAGVLAAHPRQRDRPGLLPDAAERVPAHRQGDRRPDAARAGDPRPYADGPLRHAEDLLGAVLWLLSPASAFVTGRGRSRGRRLLGLQRRMSDQHDDRQADGAGGSSARARRARSSTARRRYAASSPRVSRRSTLDGKRVLVIIPDGTRTMPMPVMFGHPRGGAGPRAAALDYLVALGTHQPMTDEQLSRLVGRPVVDGRAGGVADLQPPLGRPGHVRDARHDPGRGDPRAHGRPARAGRRGGAQPPDLRLRPGPHLRPGVSRTRSSGSRAATSTCSRASPGPASSTSRTGSAR